MRVLKTCEILQLARLIYSVALSTFRRDPGLTTHDTLGALLEKIPAQSRQFQILVVDCSKLERTPISRLFRLSDSCFSVKSFDNAPNGLGRKVPLFDILMNQIWCKLEKCGKILVFLEHVTQF